MRRRESQRPPGWWAGTETPEAHRMVQCAECGATGSGTVEGDRLWVEGFPVRFAKKALRHRGCDGVVKSFGVVS